jgi:C-terminal processing protease CtpA/Prc
LEDVPNDQQLSLRVVAAGYNPKVLAGVTTAAPLDISMTPLSPDAGPQTEMVGIGAVLRGRGVGLVVGEVMAGGGADSSGLRAGDEILAVDGASVASLGFLGAIQAIRGVNATAVVLSVLKAGTQTPQDVVVIRTATQRG